jgi:hypothetical protein
LLVDLERVVVLGAWAFVRVVGAGPAASGPTPYTLRAAARGAASLATA